MGSGGIDVFLQTDELHALLCQTGNDGQQIPGISGDAGDALHDHRVAGTDEGHHGFEILAVRILAAGLVDEDLLDLLFFHHLQLTGLVLLGGGAADIAYSHGTTPLSNSANIVPQVRFCFNELGVNSAIFQNAKNNVCDTEKDGFSICH